MITNLFYREIFIGEFFLINSFSIIFDKVEFFNGYEKQFLIGILLLKECFLTIDFKSNIKILISNIY